MAARLYESLRPKTEYYDKRSNLSPEEYQKKLLNSSTIYVGNLTIYTREETVYELFSRCGEIKELKMGLNKRSKTPCGFCFIEFQTHEDACYAVDCLNGTQLDERQVRIDWDIGFTEGRQFGRGKSGAQIRDERRKYDDPGRDTEVVKNFRKEREENHHERRYDRPDRFNKHTDRREGYSNDYRGDRRGHREGDRDHGYDRGYNRGGYNRDRQQHERRENDYKAKDGETDSDTEEQSYRRKRMKD